MDLETLYRSNQKEACELAYKQTATLSENERLEAMNVLLKGYGVESIRGEWQNGYWCDIVACYINMGDAYLTTVIQQRGDYNGAPSVFLIRSWGDWVESNQEKYDIQ